MTGVRHLFGVPAVRRLAAWLAAVRRPRPSLAPARHRDGGFAAGAGDLCADGAEIARAVVARASTLVIFAVEPATTDL
jgi:hypothetical protein